MAIDQRYAGTPTANTINGYSLDRWAAYQSVTGKYIVQQNAGSVTPPAGFSSYLGVTSQSAYSVLASDYYFIQQPIEANNMADLAFGTASAQPVTVSFWVRSSLTGSFGASLSTYNSVSGSIRAITALYTINSANTWEYKTITFAGDTGGAGIWTTGNGIGIRVNFTFGVGSTYVQAPGSWVTGNFIAAAGATSIVGTNGATFYITGVQLEKGSTATPFEQRLYTTELQLCQRYFEMSFSQGVAPANAANDSYLPTFIYYATNAAATQTIVFRVEKRVAPTGSGNTGMAFYSSNLPASPTAGQWSYYNGAWLNATSTALQRATTNSFNVSFSGTGATGTANFAAGNWTASAEF